MSARAQQKIAATAAEPEREWLESEYPSSDGVAMSETDFQARAIIDARHFLKTHFRERPDVYVSGNIFVYCEQRAPRGGQPAPAVSPDILVAFGVPRRDRRSYRVWEEGKAPDFVLEVLSRSTAARDLDGKARLYARLGVREYFLFDPAGDEMPTLLQGYRLRWGRYEPLAARGPLEVRSEVLGLDLGVDGERHLRMRDARTGENLPSAEESEAGRRSAEARAERAEAQAEREARRAERAEARLKR